MNQVGANAGLQHLGVNGSRVRIEAFGRPRTKGSLVPIHTKLGPGRCKVALTEDGRYAVPWKKTIMKAVRAQCEVSRYAGPVVVDCFFRFDRLCVPDGVLDWPTRESGEFAHGDEDKLRRNVLDALVQAGLILDDSLSIGGQNFKRWTRPDVFDETCGVLIGVRPVDATDLRDILTMEAAA